MNLTDKLALYAACLSTVLCILELIKFLKDKPSIIVKVYEALEVSSSDGEKIKPLIVIQVSNRTQRPIKIHQINALFPIKKSPPYVNLVGGNIELKECETYRYQLSKEGLSAKECVGCVVDVTGRYFWSHCFIVRWFKVKNLMLSLGPFLKSFLSPHLFKKKKL